MPTSQQTHARPIRQQIGAVLLVIAPWMLLATTLRVFGIATFPTGMVLFAGAEIALFIAFLIATHRWIEMSGGSVSYSGLDIVLQIGMAKGILYRVALVGLAAHYATWFLGLEAIYTTPLVYGFDAIAFNRFNDFTLIWGPLMASTAYLMVIDQAMGKQPTFIGAARQFSRHWRYLAPVILLLVPTLAVFNKIQWSIVPILISTFGESGSSTLKTAALITFVFVFASVRLVGTIALFTFALRASYAARST